MHGYEAIQHHIEKGRIPDEYDGDPKFSLRAIRRALAETDFSGLEPEQQARYKNLQEVVLQPGREEDMISYI